MLQHEADGLAVLAAPVQEEFVQVRSVRNEVGTEKTQAAHRRRCPRCHRGSQLESEEQHQEGNGQQEVPGVDDRRIAADHQQHGKHDDGAQKEDRFARILATHTPDARVQDDDGEMQPNNWAAAETGAPSAHDSAVP